MWMGINERTDPKTMNYYDSFYDILHTPDFNDKSRLLKPKHGMQVIGNSQNKKCRFCGKSENEASFKKAAHVFPESVGKFWHQIMNAMSAISILEIRSNRKQ